MSKIEPRQVSIVTPTADRQFCIERLRYYLKRQTFVGDIQWVISDSGLHPINLHLNDDYDFAEYRYLGHISKPHKSFCRNMQDALKRVKYERVLVMEDDDWYHPTYVETQFNRLTNKDLVGEAPALYYHIKDQSYRVLANTTRASMCQMGFRKCVIPMLQHILQQGSAFVDIKLWTHYSGKFRKALYNSRLSVGIKGMPGNVGIGIGHRPIDVHRIKDTNWQKLEEWIGKEDTNFYKGITFNE